MCSLVWVAGAYAADAVKNAMRVGYKEGLGGKAVEQGLDIGGHVFALEGGG